jgi:hypothetical protein
MSTWQRGAHSAAWGGLFVLAQVCSGGEGGNGAAAIPPSGWHVAVRLSGGAFASLADQRIERTSHVSDVILDTPVRGTAWTSGQSAVRLVEDWERAGFEVVFAGTTQSRTVGVHGPVTIHSRSHTSFRATKRVVFVPGEGFRAEPAVVEADTQTVTEDIQSGRGGIIGRAIRRRAWDRVAQTRPITTQIARQKTARRIAALFDERLDERLAELNQRLAIQQLFALLRERGRPVVACRTTPEHMQICLGDASAGGGAIELPAASASAAPIQVWVHESLAGSGWAAPALSLLQSQGADRRALLAEAILPPHQVALAAEPGSLALPAVRLETRHDWLLLQIGPMPPALAGGLPPAP